MGSASGIELAPASCVLVNARPGVGGTEVAAVRVVEPAEWPGSETALVALFTSARKTKHLPRRARVVVWGLDKPAPVSDPAVRAAVKPLVAAGFRVEAVLTPAEALVAVAATRRRPNEGPVAWLSVNMHGAAIAIVHGGSVLFSRTLRWAYHGAGQTVKEQLLRRYSLVSHIGPELQHGIARVRAAHGLKVETVVTCGDLPDLRSLTMPLIEELDLEVETLDSTDGLVARGLATEDRFAEWAPALRLACAAAVAPIRPGGIRVPRAAAAALLAVAGATVAYMLVDRDPVLPVDARIEGRGQPPSPQVQTAPPVTPQAGEPEVSQPVATTAPPETEGRGQSPSTKVAVPLVTEVERPAIERPRSSATRVAPEKKAGQVLPPIPPVTSILIDNGRRLAMVGGTIVAVGDKVGPRVVVRIDANSVVFREPSGLEITVLLRPAGLDAVKSIPFAEQDRRQATHTLERPVNE